MRSSVSIVTLSVKEHRYLNEVVLSMLEGIHFLLQQAALGKSAHVALFTFAYVEARCFRARVTYYDKLATLRQIPHWSSPLNLEGMPNVIKGHVTPEGFKDVDAMEWLFSEVHKFAFVMSGGKIRAELKASTAYNQGEEGGARKYWMAFYREAPDSLTSTEPNASLIDNHMRP